MKANWDLGEERLRYQGLRLIVAMALLTGVVLISMTVLVGAVVGVVYEIGSLGHFGWISVSSLLGVILVLRGLTFFRFKESRPGVAIDEIGQEKMINWMADAARQAGVAVPERVLLVADAKLALGIRGWFPFRIRERILLVGVALVDCMSTAGMRALLIRRLLEMRNERVSLAAWFCGWVGYLALLLRDYQPAVTTILYEMSTRVFLRLVEPIYQARQAQLDQETAEIVGREVFTLALAQQAWVQTQLHLFLQLEVLVPLAGGGIPENIFSGFRVWRQKKFPEFCLETTPGEILEQLPFVSAQRGELVERISRIAGLDENEESMATMSAVELIRDRERMEIQVTPFVTQVLQSQGWRQKKVAPLVVPWDEVGARLIVPQLRARSRRVLETLGAMARRKIGVREGIDIYLTLIDIPEMRVRLASRLDPDLAHLSPGRYPNLALAVLIRCLGSLVGCALVEAHGYHWVKEIAAPLSLEDDEGEHLDPFALCQALLEGELDVGRFRMTLFQHGLLVPK